MRNRIYLPRKRYVNGFIVFHFSNAAIQIYKNDRTCLYCIESHHRSVYKCFFFFSKKQTYIVFVFFSLKLWTVKLNIIHERIK